MSTRRVHIAAVVAMLVPAVATAQHESHQGAAAGDAARCAQVQPLVQNIITAATVRVESARQSNDPVQLRAAIASLDAALRDIRTQLAPCASPPAAAPAASPAAPAPAAEPHAGHVMPGPPSVAPAPARPAPRKPAPRKPAATDPHAGHAAPAAPAKAPSAPEVKPAEKQRDPVTGLMVDPSTALKTTYQGQTYYFSSDASRKEFLENPAKFARKR